MKIKQLLCRSIQSFSLFMLASTLISPSYIFAQSVNPDDARQLMRREYYSDPTGTEDYDLEQYFALDVVIHDFIFPSFGYASILFSMIDEPDIEYRADTQLVSELKAEKIEKKFLGKGSRAILYGWPKTSTSQHDSIMLVDEIELLKRNRNNVFAKFHGSRKGIKDFKSECDLCRGEQENFLYPESNQVPLDVGNQ